jgi:hypothetical protein
LVIIDLRIAAEHELAEADEEIGEAEGRHQQDDVGLVDQRAQHQPLDAERERVHDRDRQDRARPRRDALFVQADQRQRREHHHDALREIEHARGLVDEHEAERDQRIKHAADEALPDRLREQIGRGDHLREGIDEDRAGGVEEVHRRSSMRDAEIGEIGRSPWDPP